MSAYIVNHQTINKIVTLLSLEIRKNPYLLVIAKKFDIDVVNDGWQTKLAQAMYDLNVEAVNQRYGETNESEVILYQSLASVSRVAGFKALQCWLYQCTEGTVTETTLYKYFQEVRNRIALDIVMDLPAYETALWG